VSHPESSEAPRNRLARESSPYLLLHAANPVDWYPWGEDAFEKARREDKPIFLSVGYSTCYWCHVMERESFSDPEIARQLNEGFVAVKLDREERPELDELYMNATQLLTRSGGWPNSLFLTHDLKPFYAGTYFPPDDRYGRPGFPRVLAAVREAWSARRESVLEQADVVASAMREQMAATAGPRLPSEDVAEVTQSQLARRFDSVHGGFGGAPKFPSPANLFFLLERAEAGDAAAREMLVVTLDRMARGGIQDQLGGGFHRYSTDAEWLIPHFEKMLYDNAALAALYAAAAPLAPERGFERVARATLDFVLAELTGPDGGFLSAIDAETDGHEGAYYAWTREELEAALDPESFRLLGLVYGFDGAANFEGDRYVLHLPLSLEARALAMDLTLEELLRRLEPGRQALLAARSRRPRPLVDDKVLADWNGLMIAAMAEAGRRLEEPRYVAAASRAAALVLTQLRSPESGELRHAFRLGQAKVPALLDDYAFLVEGLLALQRASGETRWLDEARRLLEEQERRLADAAGGYFAAEGGPRLLFRSKPAFDGAVASGNGIAALNLLELGARTGEPGFEERARRVVSAFGEAIDQLPLAHVSLVRAAARLGGGASAPREPRPASGSLGREARELVQARGWLEGEERAGWRPFVVELTIGEGWHVNANPAGQPFLVPLVLSGAAGSVRRLAYPEATPLPASLAPEPVPTYSGRIEVRGEVAVAGGPPVLSLTYQACDASRCLPPATLEVALASDATSRSSQA
jgi:uncharacterized protein YyaL (SSP411 family)